MTISLDLRFVPVANLLVLLAACGSSATSTSAAADAAKVPADAASSDSAAEVSTTWPGPWSCPSAPEAACGGDLEGTTWTVVDFCPEDPTAAAALFEHPYGDMAECKPPGGTVQGKLDHEGELTFAEGKVQIKLSTVARTTYTFSDACLGAAKPGQAPAAACTGMSKADIMSCTYAASSCTCLATVPGDSSDGSEPYITVGGGTVAIGNEMQAAYCVQGDRLLLDVTPHIKSWRWWLLKRKT